MSLGKFNKYEYLTGEEVLPSNKQQIIEQARFEYSPLGKAFEKQVKTIEDQGKKQIEVLENLKLKEITPDKTKPIEYNNGSNEPINFSEYKGMMNIFKNIHSGDKTLEDIEQEQNKFKKEINVIKQGNPKKDQKNTKKK